MNGSSPTFAAATEPTIFDRMGALADPTRGRLLLLLDGRELTVSELCAVLQQPQSTVSRHLKVLTDDGWIDAWRDGTSRRYRMDVGRLTPPAAGLWGAVAGAIAELPASLQDRGRLAAVLAERRSRSQAFFSSNAGAWDRVRRDLFGREAELVPLLALLDPAWVVGDLGCGTGRTAATLAPFVARVIAVDDTPEMLTAAAAQLAPLVNVELRAGSLEALPIADAALDAALALLVLHHLADPGAALAEVGRVVRPGGRLLVVDMLPHDRERFRLEMGHQWLGFAPEALATWLAAAGFEPPRVVALPPDPEAKGPELFAATAVRRKADGPTSTPRSPR